MWNSKNWLDRSKTVRSKEESKALNKEVFENTKNVILKAKCYETDSCLKIDVPAPWPMVSGTRFYDRPFSVREIPARYDTIVKVLNKDCIEVGRDLQKEGYHPAVLNLANAHTPGGGVEHGCSAQEEQLFMRSDLLYSMYQFHKGRTWENKEYGIQENRKQYPMNVNFGGVYTPDAFVFRAGKEQGYAYLEEPFLMSFISVAGINKKWGNSILNRWEEEEMRNKIRTILRIGLHKGHDALVLGALGCGAFHNDSAQVARLFHEVIDEQEFKGKYRKLVFAILGKPFDAFQNEFKK